ncbi:MAG TPA: cysteine synthase A [Desulfobacteria bacterium]|nr:cysteine synthase A [Desulfobacteria bacterium]
MRIVNDITELIGYTPMIRINRFGPDAGEVFGKLEAFNPGRSIKDRVALSIINEAEQRGVLFPGATIVEATSGNTGVGLALVAAAKGYRLIVIMPESMSQERKDILRAYGAELLLTPAKEGMSGSLRKMEELLAENPTYIAAGQFTNPANPEAHRRTTAHEILSQTDGKIDAIVAGIGTGGTITGIGEVLKDQIPGILVVGVEPAGSAVLSGGACGPHMLQGIGAGFVPEVLNRAILDRVIPVQDHEAYLTMTRLAQREGVLAGISSGAAVFAAGKIAKELGPGKRVVAILPDTGERYLSMDAYFKLQLRRKGISLND